MKERLDAEFAEYKNSGYDGDIGQWREDQNQRRLFGMAERGGRVEEGVEFEEWHQDKQRSENEASDDAQEERTDRQSQRVQKQRERIERRRDTTFARKHAKDLGLQPGTPEFAAAVSSQLQTPEQREHELAVLRATGSAGTIEASKNELEGVKYGLDTNKEINYAQIERDLNLSRTELAMHLAGLENNKELLKMTNDLSREGMWNDNSMALVTAAVNRGSDIMAGYSQVAAGLGALGLAEQAATVMALGRANSSTNFKTPATGPAETGAQQQTGATPTQAEKPDYGAYDAPFPGNWEDMAKADRSAWMKEHRSPQAIGPSGTNSDPAIADEIGQMAQDNLNGKTNLDTGPVVTPPPPTAEEEERIGKETEIEKTQVALESGETLTLDIKSKKEFVDDMNDFVAYIQELPPEQRSSLAREMSNNTNLQIFRETIDIGIEYPANTQFKNARWKFMDYLDALSSGEGVDTAKDWWDKAIKAEHIKRNISKPRKGQRGKS